MADSYYKGFQLKRVYFSGYIPISEDTRMPALGSQPPLLRENRLYQSDWLMRFYGFDIAEIVNDQHPNLDTQVDPKLAWALRNPHYFPVDINTADYYQILRVPGIGVKSAKKIVQARRFAPIRSFQLKQLGVAYNRAQHFMICADSRYGYKEPEPHQIRAKILAGSSSKFLKTDPQQLTLFT